MTLNVLEQPHHTLPDGPQSPQLWQLLQWIARPLDFMDSCAQRYGDLFTVHLSDWGPLIFCCHPDAIQAIFTAPSQTFDAGKSNRILRPLMGDHSLVLLDGAPHRRQRQLLMPQFHGERMRAYGDLIHQITQTTTCHFRVGHPVVVRPLMQTISLQVILKAVFGVTNAEQYQDFIRLLPAVLDRTGSPLSASLLFLPWLQQDLGSWSPWGQFVRQKAQLDRLLYREIDQRRCQTESDRADILSLLLAVRDENGEPMTDVELRDQLITMLTAGHETTASALSWALYWIHREPEVLETLTRELADCDLSETKALMRLPYLDAVCAETLRIYPIAPLTFPRVANRPVQVMGYAFEPGTILAPCVYLLHRRPDLYINPEVFQPQRFIDRQFSPYEYIPFGGGDRRCLGMTFALFEMKLVLASLLTHFRFRWSGQYPIKPARRGVTIAPPGNLMLTVDERL